MRPTKGIAVDGSCIGNPGPAEYRGVDLSTEKELFRVNIGHGTNNIAEFVGVVHALAICEGKDVYTDSTTAIAWVRNRRCNSSMKHDFVDRAEGWLRKNGNGQGSVKKWDTRTWVEIPADFGRKQQWHK